MARQGKRGTAAIVLVALVTVVGAPPASAYQRPGRTEHVSVSAGGSSGDGNSYGPSISGDGRYVAFASEASNLVPDDTNGVRDIFVHDRATGVTRRVSVASDGTQTKTWSSNNPTLSADGRTVAFESVASTLVPGDTNGASDIFVHDLETGLTERASVASGGTQVFGTSANASLSADGRHVAFTSSATGLVPDDTNGVFDIFVHDRVDGETERVSVGTGGTEGGGNAQSPSISDDGRHVAFLSYATELVPNDTNGVPDVFVYDRETGNTERVSVASDGTQGAQDSTRAAISGHGRYVAFHSLASNLVPSDINVNWDVFVHDRETGITERVSLPSDGVEQQSTLPDSGSSINASISADGRYVAFQSFAANLVAGDTNGSWDMFLHDRLTATTERVSLASDGAEAVGDDLMYPAVAMDKRFLSADGRHVAFWSAADNLAPEGPGTWDVFVRHRGPELGIGGVSAARQSDGVAVSGWATFSGAVVSSVAGLPTGAEAGAWGADLVGASLTYRPEHGDLLARVDLASLPTPDNGRGATGAGYPAVLYGFGLRTTEARYEARVVRASATTVPADAPHFGLYRCDPTCEDHAPLTGGIGTAGSRVVVSIPLSSLGVAEGETLTGLGVFTALGEAATGAVAALDEAALPDVMIPEATVRLGLAPAGSPREGVSFDTIAALADGSFDGILDARGHPPGNYDVWARACLGETCSATATPLHV